MKCLLSVVYVSLYLTVCITITSAASATCPFPVNRVLERVDTRRDEVVSLFSSNVQHTVNVRLQRQTRVLECIPHHYGIHCLPCECQGFPCEQGNRGSGRCLCPPRWYWNSEMKRCFQEAYGWECIHNVTDGTLLSCSSCFGGRQGPTCNECDPSYEAHFHLIHSVPLNLPI